MQNPLISVIICTYNRKKYISETINSVLEQEYSPIEILVIDDGSTDGTDKLIHQYGDKVIYHKQENKGITTARNTGCKLANGEYITFQDDDDPMPPNKLTLLYAALNQYQSSVLAVGDLAFIDENGVLTGYRWLPENKNSKIPVLIEQSHEAILWPRVPATPNTTLFSKKYGEQINWFDTEFIYGSEDKDFYARLALIGPIVYVPEIVTLYRRGHASMTQKTFLIAYSQVKLFCKHFALTATQDTSLKARLQERTLKALKELETYKTSNTKLTNHEYHQCIKDGLSLLNSWDIIEYLAFKYIKLPTKNMLKNLLGKK